MTDQPGPSSTHARAQLGGVLTVLLTLLGWASVPLFLRHFTGSLDAWTTNGWRYGFSALVWLPVLLVSAARGGLPRGLWRAAFVPGLFNTLGQVCFALAIYHIDPGLMSFGLRLQIVFVALGAAFFFPAERRIVRSPWYVAGVALVLCGTLGTLLLSRPGSPAGDPASGPALSAAAALAGHPLGVALSVVSGLFFAGYALSVRHFMHGMEPIRAFAAISQYTAAAMVGLMLILGARHGAVPLAWFADSPRELLLLALSALLGIALGHVFYYISIARLGVAATTGVIQLQPFCVAAASAPLYGERLRPVQWACGCVAVCGAAMMLSVQWRAARAGRLTAVTPGEEADELAPGVPGLTVPGVPGRARPR